MRYIKLFEEYTDFVEVQERVIRYRVVVELLDMSTEPLLVEVYDNYDDALNSYNELYEYEDGGYRTYIHTKYLEKVLYEVKYQYEPEYEEKGDIDDSDKEWEIIDDEVLKYEDYQINQHSYELLDEIEKWFKERYDSKKRKYHQIRVYYNEEDYKTIQVRIADHTENIHNVDRFTRPDYHLSIVISDYDVTDSKFGMVNSFERRSNEMELKFKSSDNIDIVKSDIEHEVNNIKEEILLMNT